jgi:hypothetical protein
MWWRFKTPKLEKNFGTPVFSARRDGRYHMYLATTFEVIGWWGAVAKMLLVSLRVRNQKSIARSMQFVENGKAFAGGWAPFLDEVSAVVENAVSGWG